MGYPRFLNSSSELRFGKIQTSSSTVRSHGKIKGDFGKGTLEILPLGATRPGQMGMPILIFHEKIYPYTRVSPKELMFIDV